jgi:hypothetical protein
MIKTLQIQNITYTLKVMEHRPKVIGSAFICTKVASPEVKEQLDAAKVRRQ